jgi:hypothetical protein
MARLRTGRGSTYRLALWCRDDDRPEAFRFFLCLWRQALRQHRRRSAGSKQCKKAERRDGRAQPALDRNTSVFVGVALIGMKTRARNSWRTMTMFEIRQITARRRNTTPSARLPLQSALAQSGR